MTACDETFRVGIMQEILFFAGMEGNVRGKFEVRWVEIHAFERCHRKALNDYRHVRKGRAELHNDRVLRRR